MSLVRRVLGKAKRAARNMLGESPNESTSAPSKSPADSRLAPQSHPAFDVDHEKPLVTVVVPCFNNARFVGDTLRSVSEQSLTNFECIVVDDASTDESARVIAEATAGDERFKVVRHKANAGLSAARNTGLRNALAATITFLDSDDLLMVDSLLDRYVRLEQSWSDPYVAGSFSGISYDGEDVTFDNFPVHKKWSDGSPDKRLVDFVTAQGECPFPAHAPLLKTGLLIKVGGFDENLRTGAEDWDLWLRLMRNGYVFVPAEHRTVVYRQRPDSMVRSMAANHARTAAALIDQAYTDADPALFVAPTDAPFPRGLAFYESAIAKSRRLVRFAAIELAGREEGEASPLLSQLPQLPLPILRRHVDVYAEYARGMKRVTGHTGRDLSVIKPELDRYWDSFEKQLIDSINESGSVEPRAQDRLDDPAQSRSVAAGLPSWRSSDPSEERPIFVASLGRSGSTLLQRILNTHPEITIWGEHAGYLTHIARLIEETIEDESFRNRLKKNTKYRDVIVGRLKDTEAFMPWAAPLTSERFQSVIAGFVRDLFAADLPPGTRWGFKEIRYGRSEYEALRTLFPNATVLVMIRDLGGYLRSRARAWRPNVAANAADERAAFEQMLAKYVNQWMNRNQELLDIVDSESEMSFTVPFDRLSEGPEFGSALLSKLVEMPADEALIESVLSNKAGSSDAIAGDDWDERSTKLLFEVVDSVVSSNEAAQETYARALKQSELILPP